MAQNISKKLSYIGENIKKIRQVKRISQAAFASNFNLARPSIGAYEEGRSEPKIDTIIQIANYYGISIDVLLTRQLTVSEILSLGMLNEKLNKAHQIKQSKGDPSKNSQIPFVQLSQYLDYVVNHENSEYVQNLPEVSIPYGEVNNELRAFEMQGREMEYHHQGIQHGDILIAERSGKELLAREVGRILTIVHKAGLYIRRLKEMNKSEITLVADDPNYPEKSIKLSEVLEVWVVESAFTKHLNPPTFIEKRVLKLESEMVALKNSMNK